jgi:CRISPR/Cas system CSM-associated protein Csm3 (group 7 of RAMP superfamily)
MRATRVALARVTIEATSPLTVGTGGGTDLVDSVCVQDANGLPAVPGSSLAGLLRHALPGGPEGSDANELFGYQLENDGARSRASVSWAQVHGRDGRPRPFLALEAPADREDRAFLEFLVEGVHRDHVALNGRGAADGRKKFDEVLVPRGARFTFELRVDGDDDRDPGPDLELLLGALASAGFRVGGRTRRGYGAIRLVAAPRRVFDLRRAEDRDAWARLPRALHEHFVPELLATTALPEPNVPAGYRAAKVVLTAQDYWLFGGGLPTRPAQRRPGERGKAADALPKTERVIIWRDGVARVVPASEAPNLVPATSVKGALRHRTLYHACALAGAWADTGADPPVEVRAAVEWLFGREHTNSDERGEPGRVLIEDVHLSATGGDGPRDGWFDHVSLDRFTGGPMDGMLFSEAPLHGKGFSLRIVVDAREVPPRYAREALRRTLDDLTSTRLALGAASNRGHGFFQGEVVGDPDGGLPSWLEGERHA